MNTDASNVEDENIPKSKNIRQCLAQVSPLLLGKLCILRTEQDWSTSQISDTQRGPTQSWSWRRASQCPHLAYTKACQQQEP